jgi:hypothetical protein
MSRQEQAFRAYYASMTDGDLLTVAANRSSFVDLAQRILTEEMARRNLAVPEPTTGSRETSAARGPSRWFRFRFGRV